MANRPRAKMPVSERAKQFMPFAAVKGLDEALQQKRHERELIPRAELSDEQADTLNARLSRLQRGMDVAIRHYVAGEYEVTQGPLEQIDLTARRLRVAGRIIAFDDISNITIRRTEP